MDEKNTKQRIGVYVCHCWGNISEFVDKKKLGMEQKNTIDG